MALLNSTALKAPRHRLTEKSVEVFLKLVPSVSEGTQATHRFFATFLSVVAGIGLLKYYSYIYGIEIKVMADNKNTSSGIGLGTILFLIFLTLKLGGWGVVATWSWWWVFSPIWAPLSVYVFFIIIGLIIYFFE